MAESPDQNGDKQARNVQEWTFIIVTTVLVLAAVNVALTILALHPLG